MPLLPRSQRISTNSKKFPRLRQANRGVILLIVASLLTLLLLIGVTFVLLASRSLDRAKIGARRDEVGDQPEKEFDLVLGQLLYDTAARSSLNGHSLLEDLYGRDLLAGTLASVGTPQWGGQAIAFTANFVPAGHSPIFDYYTGRVLTFIDGPLAGQSTRILQFDPTIPQFVVEAQTSAAVPQLGNRFLVNGAPFNGAGAGYDTATRNIDATYTGNGATTANLMALLPHFNGYDPIASAYDPAAIHAGGLDESWDAVDFQNMYLAMVPPTAAEWNTDNDPTSQVPIIPSFHRPELVNYWRNHWPSEITSATPTPNVFANPLLADLLRTFNFRPMPWDHPNFSGGNPALDASALRQQVVASGITSEPQISEEVTRILLDNLSNLNGTWDVDNDGDGVNDSVWIDPGLPVVTSSDGKRYKRLAAILVKDMESRVDLNAHGNLSHVDVSSGVLLNLVETPLPFDVGLAGAGTYLYRGMGYGPAEVNLFWLLKGDVDAYRRILQGKYASNVPGPGPTMDFGAAARPGIPGGSPPTYRDALDIVKQHGVPNNYPALGMWYSSPPDVWGKSIVALDHGGHPIYANTGLLNEMYDNPYELALNGLSNNADSPYTRVELERILRYHDPDAQRIVSRPLVFASSLLGQSGPGVIGPDHTVRERLGSGHSHIPAPSAFAPQGSIAGTAGIPWRSQLPTSVTILDLYYARLAAAGLVEPQLSAEFAKIVPWEFRHGGKLDINRWFGDGFDNNGNGAIDEPRESVNDPTNPAPFNGAREPAWQGGPAGFGGTLANHSNGVDVNQDGVVNGIDRGMAKQLYARHLYCLAMLMFDNVSFPNASQLAAPFHEGTLSAPGFRELFIRRIAQWAVNVVDFRDPDGIMTGFEYDVNPWDGWHVDGNLATDGVTAPEIIFGNAVANGQRRLVWGTEYPDLLITETFHTHSRGVKDTELAGPNDTTRGDAAMPDDDLDQFRIPQGSLFIEFWSPRPFNWLGNASQKPRVPTEMYDAAGNLKLGQLAPGGRPVWRIALAPLLRDDPNYGPRHPQQMAGTNPESGSFEPHDAYLLAGGALDGPVGPLDQFRYAYFANAALGVPPAELAYSYYNTISSNPGTGAPLLQPGQYAVLGPRQVTYFGSMEASANTPILWDPMAGVNGHSPQRVVLDPTGAVTPNGVEVYDTTGTLTSRVPGAGSIRPILPIIANYTGLPTTIATGAWTTRPQWTSGLNVTEPLINAPGTNYYPEPYDSTTIMMGTPNIPLDLYDDPDETVSTRLFPDEPVEGTTGTTNGGRPIFENTMQATGTYEDVSSVYLQRLADPTLAYNPFPGDPNHIANLPVNPYITVDWSTIDVTVFAGDEDTDAAVAGGPIDPDDDPMARPDMLFRSRQRGNPQTPPPFPPNQGHNPWTPVTANGGTFPVTPAAGVMASGPYFTVDLSNDLDNNFTPLTDRHTLGYLNGMLGYPQSGTLVPAMTPGLGEPMDPLTIPYSAPFPWFAHLNRPFANPFELLLVPSSAPARLAMEFTPGQLTPNLAASPYDAANAGALRAPFGHLLNFFHSDENANAANSPHLHRIFDYVEVPSPFLGAERWFNPANFSPPAPPASPTHLYNPPFNKLSRFRDPGRMNINTITDDVNNIYNIFNAAFSTSGPDLPGFYISLNDVALNRRAADGEWWTADPNLPTLFGNPFRATDASDLMPNVGGMRRNNPVEAGFLRPYSRAPGSQQPLFGGNNDWIGESATRRWGNRYRNAYFRYQVFQKLGNTFSTHSNVFAVWMTMGYFEVEDSPRGVTAAHPDGLAFGQEIGADSGEITRHRAFYMIDRSVPVGFAPGQKLNTDDCVLLRRMIE